MSSRLTLTLTDCTSLVALPDTLVEPGTNRPLVLGWNETTVTLDEGTRASVITVPGVTPATDADEAEKWEDLHLMRRKRDEWARDQPEEEHEAEVERKALESWEDEGSLSDTQRPLLRRLRRRVCDTCGRQGTLEVERFPVCYCGARRYCDEECQRVDWLTGHSKTCASGHTFPPGPLGGLRESKKRASDSKEAKECYERFRDLIFSQSPPPADRPR